MTGSLLLTAMGFAQGLWQVPIPRWCYVAVTGCFLTWAFYRTWRKEHTEVESVRDEKDVEIAALKERVAQLGRKPYTEDLERIVRQLIDQQMTLEGRHVLRQLMIHERIEVGREIVVLQIPQERQQEQLAIAMQQGVVRHRDESRGGRAPYLLDHQSPISASSTRFALRRWPTLMEHP